MADTVILNGQDIGQAQRATSAVLGEHGTTFDRWFVLNAPATWAFPPRRAGIVAEELCSGIPEADLAAARAATRPAEPAR